MSSLLGNLFGVGLNIAAKVGVSSGTIWSLGIMVFLKVLDLVIDWKNASDAQKKAYLDLVTAAQNLAPIPVGIMQDSENTYNQLIKEAKEAQAAQAAAKPK